MEIYCVEFQRFFSTWGKIKGKRKGEKKGEKEKREREKEGKSYQDVV